MLATLGISVSLALAALAGPVTVLAAPAPLAIGFGPTIDVHPDPATGALPSTVEPGAHVAFELWAKNDGSSNISKLFLTALTAGTHHSVTWTNNGTSGTCGASLTAGVGLQCNWLQVSPGATITVKVVFETPSAGTSMPVKFEWSTSGYVLSTKGKNKSHGDAFEQSDTVTLDGDPNKFAGGYLVQGDDTTVATGSNLNRQNPQSTKITAPAINIPVTASEQDNIADCQALFSDCFGQASVINVGNGTNYGPGGFRVDVVFSVNKPGAEPLHIFDDGTVDEDLVACGAVPVAPCYQVSTAQGKTFLTLYLLENGKIFGH